MSVARLATEPLEKLEQHLATQMTSAVRRNDFDMNDEPETQVLGPFNELQTSLLWLQKNVGERWREADRQARINQRRHRALASTAIATGTFAIVIAIVQLSIKLTVLGLTTLALWLEGITVAAAVICVVIGLWTKLNRRWLGQRHLAERLRMLKFRALEQLWCYDDVGWRQWVEKQLATLEGADDPAKIEEWATRELIEPDLITSLKFAPNPSVLRALTTYYRFKRVEFQAGYFARRRDDLRKEVGHWLGLNLRLFFASVACVILHFGLEYVAGKVEDPKWEHFLDDLAVWFVALAAIISVLGLGMRAWLGAFELPRSANIFAAKHRALTLLTNDLQRDVGTALPTLHHMAQAEHFLEQEHREWLRLLSDTEWFL